MMKAMMRALAMPLLAVLSLLIGVAGCATRSPVRPAGVASSPAREPAALVTGVTPSSFATAFMMPVGGPNPEATIPNPGTGSGNPLLAQALLPQSAPPRLAPTQLPPGVVALPDRDLRSLFVGLRQYGSPVIGPRACDGWTAGLSAVVLTSFNQPGVQLGAELAMRPLGFAETIITGPPSVLDALADPPLPTACRDIATPHYSGGVKPVTASVPGAVGARAFEVTGTGKFPVWIWAEVIRGENFVLEIRAPVQSANPDPGAALPAIAANAYHRAATVLG